MRTRKKNEEPLLSEARLAEEHEREQRTKTIKDIVESYLQSETSAFGKMARPGRPVEIGSIVTADNGTYTIRLDGVEGTIEQLNGCKRDVPRVLGSCYHFSKNSNGTYSIYFQPKVGIHIAWAMIYVVLLIALIMGATFYIVTYSLELSRYISTRDAPGENIRAAALLLLMRGIGVSA